MLSIRKGLAVVLAGALFAAGCGAKTETPKTDTPAAPAKTVNITFWHGMDETAAHGKVLKSLIEEYNNSQKEVHVDATYQGSYTDLEKKLTAAIAASTQPTVVQNTDSMLSNLVRSKAVIAMDSYLANDKADYIPALMKAVTYPDGKTYGVPFNKSAIVLIYNKNLVKTPPKTWDEFKKVAKDVTVAGKTYGTAFNADVYYFGTHFAQAGGQWLNADQSQSPINTEAGQAAMGLIVDMVKNGSAIQLKPNEYQSNYFNEGRAAMIATTSASYAFINPADKSPWGVAPLYAGPKGEATPLSGANLSIVNGTKPEEQAAAAKFILWLTSKDSTIKWAMGKTGYGPVRTSAITDSKWVEFTKANPEYGVLSDALTKGVVQPSIPQWQNVQKAITTAVEKSVGGGDIKAALDEAAKAAADALAKK